MRYIQVAIVLLGLGDHVDDLVERPTDAVDLVQRIVAPKADPHQARQMGSIPVQDLRLVDTCFRLGHL